MDRNVRIVEVKMCTLNVAYIFAMLKTQNFKEKNGQKCKDH